MRPERERALLEAVREAREQDSPLWRGAAPRESREPSLAEGERARWERQRLFWGSWLPVARADAAPAPGHWQLRRVAGAEIVVARGEDGALRAMRNACRHRGSSIVDGPGCGARLVCPYHGWSYALDGALIDAPSQGQLPEVSLVRCGVEEALGYLWLHLGERPPPLLDFLGEDLLDDLEEWGLDGLACHGTIDRDCAFPWRVGVEGFLEPQHVPLVHPRSVHPVVRSRWTVMEALGSHSLMILPLRDPALYGPSGLFGRAAADAGVPSLASLNTLQRSSNLVYLIWPSLVLNFLPSHLAAIQILPTEEGRCSLSLSVLGPPCAGVAAEAYWRSLTGSYERLVDEDAGAFARVWRGGSGPELPEPLWSPYDGRIRHFRAALAACYPKETRDG